MMDFQTYCKTKKIDPEKFQKQESELFNELKAIFDQVNLESFTQQKLFLINSLRHKYRYEGPAPEIQEEVKKSAGMPKPVMKPGGGVSVKPKLQPKMSGIKPKIQSNTEEVKPKIQPKMTGVKPKIAVKPSGIKPKVIIKPGNIKPAKKD